MRQQFGLVLLISSPVDTMGRLMRHFSRHEVSVISVHAYASTDDHVWLEITGHLDKRRMPLLLKNIQAEKGIIEVEAEERCWEDNKVTIAA